MSINEFREDRRKEDHHLFMGVNEVAFTRVL
jgi:hypothetical protein